MKLFIIIAVSIAGLVFLAWMLPPVVHSSVPSAEIYPRPDGKFELVNTGREPLYFTGYSPSDCLMVARFADPGKRLDLMGFCGTGLERQRLNAGKSVIVSTYLHPDAYSGEPIVVECQVSGYLSGWERAKGWLASEIPVFRRLVPSASSAPQKIVETKKYVPMGNPALTATSS